MGPGRRGGEGGALLGSRRRSMRTAYCQTRLRRREAPSSSSSSSSSSTVAVAEPRRAQKPRLVDQVEEVGGEAMGESMLFPNLPDDLSIQCIARVPRSSHPSLLLVSRSWRSLLRSRRLFSLRADLGVTEPSLCICTISSCSGRWCCRWYFLNLHPCRLLPLPPPPFPASHTACAALGSSLYVLRGCDERTGIPLSTVQIFDACLNRWTTGPPIAEGRGVYVTNVFEGRIYIFRSSDHEPGQWADVLDPESGVWASLPRCPAHLQLGFSLFRGQLLLSPGFLLDPEVAQLRGILLKVSGDDWFGPDMVMPDGVLYGCNTKGELGGYDPTAGVWKRVEGLEGELPNYSDCAQLTNMGGLLCLVWIQGITEGEWGIHCVGIKITRTGSGGFLGSIAWREALGMPSCPLMVCHAVVLEF